MSKTNIENIIYGAVEDVDVTTSTPYRYTGYCKKLNSEDPILIEAYLDGELLQTLSADREIEQLNDLYNAGKHCFSLTMDPKYFDTGHTIAFKTASTKEHILGSPLKMRYTEKLFFNTLEEHQKLDAGLHGKNTIGFLGLNDVISNTEFMEYIKQLCEEFPQSRFIAFYFDAPQKAGLETAFEKQLPQMTLYKATSLQDIVSNVEVFLLPPHDASYDAHKLAKLAETITEYFHNIFLLKYFPDKTRTLAQLDKAVDKHPTGKYLDRLGYSEDDVKRAQNSLFKLRYENLLQKETEPFSLDLDQNAYTFFNFAQVRFALENENFNEAFFHLRAQMRKINDS